MLRTSATTWTPAWQIRGRVLAMRRLGYRWVGCYRAQGCFHGLYAILKFTWEGR